MSHKLGKVSLLLAGGGAAGINQLGQIRALMDVGIRYDQLYGVSVGALNGALLHQNRLAELNEIWLSIRNEDVYRFGIGSAIKMAQGSKAVFDHSPLLKLLKHGVDVSRLRANKLPFFVTATDLQARAPYCRNVVELDDPHTLLWASASVPALFPNVRFDGRDLADGGLVSNWSLVQAVRDGIDTIILLRPRREGAVQLNTVFDEVAYLVNAQQAIALDREKKIIEILNNYKRYIRIIEVIPKDVTTIGLLDFNLGTRSERQAMIDKAYSEALEQILNALALANIR